MKLNWPNQLKIYLVVSEKYFLVSHWKNNICFLLQNGVTCLQLRFKTFSPNKMLEIALQVKVICDKYHSLFIINDYLWLAKKSEADGIHLGQTDVDLLTCKKNLSCQQIIGWSISNKTQYQLALKLSPNYLGIGAVYPTKSKSDAEIFTDYSIFDHKIKFPFVFIGGLNDKNCLQLLKFHPFGFAYVSFLLDNVYNIKKIRKISF